MTKKGLDRMESKTVCTAKRRNGEQCLNYAIKGANVCRMHGGSAPQVRAAAQTRILMASDRAAAKLIELMSSPKVADRVKLAAAKDLLDRANIAGKQSIEVGVTKRSFEDVTSDVVMDLFGFEDEDDQPLALTATPEDIEDAEVVDDEELWQREDAAAERAAEHKRMLGRTPRLPSDLNAQRARQEAEALRQAEPKPMRKTSTADPYADRFPETRATRGSMSPKRWAERNGEGKG